jgi:hypothetical protein
MELTEKAPKPVRDRIATSIPSEDVLVRSSFGYMPEYTTEVFGRTSRNCKDVTLTRLLNILRDDYPEHRLISLGTPVNFDVAPSHLTRVEMTFKTKEQVDACIKEISVSDLLIRLRVQPAWDWQSPAVRDLSVVLHVGWYDTVYFLKNRDIFLDSLHCRYSAKFNYDPREAQITHFRYLDDGTLDKVGDLTEFERQMDELKDKVEFVRVFRDGTQETT